MIFKEHRTPVSVSDYSVPLGYAIAAGQRLGIITAKEERFRLLYRNAWGLAFDRRNRTLYHSDDWPAINVIHEKGTVA